MKQKTPSFFLAFVPILFLIIFLSINVLYYGEDATYGPNQIALLLSGMAAVLVGLKLGFKWKELQKGIVDSINSALPAIIILLLIGALAGTWMMSGIVPTMIYYGLEILNPTIFLVAACVVSAIIALATGSSWTTVATVGVALIGIGTALGMSQGMVAGAIISGAYFGDKMSPLSDTTNLAPAMAGTDLVTHIKYMSLTTIPSILITLVIFLILGFFIETKPSEEGVGNMLNAIDSTYNISPLLFVVPGIVILLIVKKMPAIPALFIGTLLGVVAAIIFQPEIVKEISGETGSYFKASYKAAINSMSYETAVQSGFDNVDKLVKTKGMNGMLNTIWLIVCAMCFGGVMEAAGLLQKITKSIVVFAKSTGSLIATTAGTCIFFNATASDQYLAIVVPGKMFEDIYPERGLKPENLSRTLEDAGTVTSVLFPWNTCGAAQSSVLSVATGEYWIYCFFNLISPVMTVLYGYLNIRIARTEKKVN
ncbi:MAG: Na+/H+ antiporter NhaC [Flavobacteriales bacterium]|nr:Na+/H+ antiporter NhaC [Flavobacteriales bacterium]